MNDVNKKAQWFHKRMNPEQKSGYRGRVHYDAKQAYFCQRPLREEPGKITLLDYWTDERGKVLTHDAIRSRSEELEGVWGTKIYTLDENGLMRGILDDLELKQATELVMGSDAGIGVKCIPYPFTQIPPDVHPRRTEFGSYEFDAPSSQSLKKVIEAKGGLVLPKANLDGILIGNEASTVRDRRQLVVDENDQFYNIFAIPNIVGKEGMLFLLHEEEESYIISAHSRHPERVGQRIQEFSERHDICIIEEV